MGDSRAGLVVPEESVKRACDQCHIRKVKCDGRQPCARCAKKRVNCSFDNPVLPKGPAPWAEKPRKARRPKPYEHSRPTAAVDYPTSTSNASQTATIEADSSPSEIAGAPAVESLEEIPFPILDVNISEIPLGSGIDDEVEDTVAALVPWDSSTDYGYGTWPLVQSDLRPGLIEDCISNPLSAENTSAEEAWLRMLLQTRPTTPVTALPGTFDYAIANSNGAPTLNGANLSCINSYATNPPIYNMPFTPREDISPILTLTLESLIRPQLDTFYDRIYPMLPVFPPSYLFSRLADPVSRAQPDFVALVLAKCSMSLIHPLMTHEMPERPMRLKQAKVLLDEACRLLAKWDHGCSITLEAIMTSYLMFGILFEMGQTGGAKLRLREALIMGETMELHQPASYKNLGTAEVKRRMRMYWVLAVTERAWALQRRGTLTFPGTIKRAHEPNMHAACLSIYYLTELFSHFDKDIIACWNDDCPRGSGGHCRTLTPERAVKLLADLKASAPRIYDPSGTGNPELNSLNESQKADLFITWQWARNRIWTLCSTHGLTREGAESELSVEYIVDVAATTVGICKKLPLAAMEAHGTGFVEKIYDVGSVLTNLLQSTQPDVQAKLISIVQTNVWGETLQSLYAFLALHRGGSNSFAADLGQAISYTGISSSSASSMSKGLGHEVTSTNVQLSGAQSKTSQRATLLGLENPIGPMPVRSALAALQGT